MILDVDVESDFRQVKKAYYRRAKKCHPDLFEGSRAKEEEFKLLVQAFDVLSDPEKRARYDRIKIGETSAASTDADYGFAGDPDEDEKAIMDTAADDTLEEIIVGNDPPEDTRLSTLFLDLEKTEVFMTYREAKNLFHEKRYKTAMAGFRKLVELAPRNILYRCYLARTYAVAGRTWQSRAQYKAAIRIGERRIPKQRLQRVRSELESLGKESYPWFYGLISAWKKQPENIEFADPAKDMVNEANRSISRIIGKRNRELREENRKRIE